MKQQLGRHMPNRRYMRPGARLGGKRGHNGKKRVIRRSCAAAVAFLAVFSFFCLWPHHTKTVQNNLDAPYQIAYNRTAKARTKDDICYIVVHDTANRSRGADAMRHYTFFNRENQASSADFFVDDTQILQVNDYFTYYTWHCGDGKGSRQITNQNSIGVEICVNRDGNYRRAVSHAEYLIERLMAELEIDTSHVVRHYDASGKNCPASMERHNWRKWEQFKKAIQLTDLENKKH